MLSGVVHAEKADLEAGGRPAETAPAVPPLLQVEVRELRIALDCYGGVSLAI